MILKRQKRGESQALKNESKQSYASEIETIKLSDNGEFDPGSGRTLAACFIHASRTRSYLRVMESGGRVSKM